MRPVVWMFLFLAAALVFASPVLAADIVTVRVTGTGMSESEALDDALRKAVEKGSGVEVTSRTETLDHAVAFDRIVTRAKGYVAGFEEVEKKKKWDLWQVTIDAKVDQGKIGSDWGDIQLLLERKGRPTVMVLIKETVFDSEGKPQEAQTEFASSAIEQLFIEKGFQLKSAKGLDEIEKRRRDAAIARNDLDALASIAKQFGANVMIVGNSTCRFSGKADVHGVHLVHYRAAASITAYNSDTADLLLSTTMEGKGSGMGEFKAITMAFKRSAENVSEDVLRKLLNRWYFEFQHGASLVVRVTLLADSAKALRRSGKMVIRLEQMLAEIENVEDVKMTSFDKEAEKAFAQYTVKTTLPLEKLRNHIILMDTENLGFTLEWVGSDKNTLRLNLYIE